MQTYLLIYRIGDNEPGFEMRQGLVLAFKAFAERLTGFDMKWVRLYRLERDGSIVLVQQWDVGQ